MPDVIHNQDRIEIFSVIHKLALRIGNSLEISQTILKKFTRLLGPRPLNGPIRWRNFQWITDDYEWSSITLAWR